MSSRVGDRAVLGNSLLALVVTNSKAHSWALCVLETDSENMKWQMINMESFKLCLGHLGLRIAPVARHCEFYHHVKPAHTGPIVT